MVAGRKWTREELLVALNVYRKLPFGQLDARNAVVKEVAGRLERSAGSLAMKLCNFASLDPIQKTRGIRGLEGASVLDRVIWAEFQEKPQEVAVESEDALRGLLRATEEDEVEVEKDRGIRIRPPSGPTEQIATVKVRRAQQFFRGMILNAFNARCCVSGLPVRELLVASHILPWGRFPKDRLNPQNGLCLSRLHDGAFDSGLIAFDENRRMLMSTRLRSWLPQRSVQENFEKFEGTPFTIVDDAIEPSAEFLRYHRENQFQR